MGDEILAAGEAQRLYDADPRRRVAICDCDGVPRWDSLWSGNPIIARPEDVEAGEPVHRVRNARGCRPYMRYPFDVAVGWEFTTWRARDHRAKLYLTSEERGLGIALAVRVGGYVVVEPSPGAKSNPNKRWPFDRFAAVVAACPHIRFVQMLHSESTPLPGAEHVATADFRAACGVLAAARGYLGTEGGLHHASAALGVGGVVIFGGCASVATTGYDLHINLADTGPRSPCGQHRPCEHCRAAMDAIGVLDVCTALETALGEPWRQSIGNSDAARTRSGK